MRDNENDSGCRIILIILVVGIQKFASWYLGYRTFLEENSDIFQIVAINLTILGQNGYKNYNLWYSSSQNDYKWVGNNPMFTFMPHVVTKFTKYLIWIFFIWKCGYRTQIFFLLLWFSYCKKFNYVSNKCSISSKQE